MRLLLQQALDKAVLRAINAGQGTIRLDGYDMCAGMAEWRKRIGFC